MIISSNCRVTNARSYVGECNQQSSSKRLAGPLKASKFDPSLLETSSQKGRRRKKKKVQKGDEFEGLDASKLYRAPRDTVLADEEIPHPMVVGILQSAMDNFYDQNPPLANFYNGIYEEKFPQSKQAYDYFEFRTVEVEGMGIDHIAKFWEDYGYERMDEVVAIAGSKTVYQWLSGPSDKEFPRIVISSVKIEDLSSKSQEIMMRRLKDWIPMANKHVSGALAARITPWESPTKDEFESVYEDNDFAAWVLINGYAVACATLSVNAMVNPLYRFGKPQKATSLEDFVAVAASKQQILLYPVDDNDSLIHENSAGTMRQIGVVADIMEYMFSDGQRSVVVGSYLSAIERGILPEYKEEKGAGSKRTHLYSGIDKELMGAMINCTAMALPLTAQQLNLQSEVFKRAKMDGYDLQDENLNNRDELVMKYVDIVLKDQEAEALRG